VHDLARHSGSKRNPARARAIAITAEAGHAHDAMLIIQAGGLVALLLALLLMRP